MSSSPKSSPPRWYLPFAVLVSVVFLYFAIRGVKWDEFAAHVAQCRLEFLIPGLALGLVNYVFRSQRWGVLVKARQPVSARTLFWSAGVGYLGNNYLPFRSDAVIRTVALAKKTGIGMAYVLATALTERVLDAIFLILLALFLIPTISQAPDWLTSAMWGFGLVGLAALIFLFLAPLLERQIHTIFHRLPLPARWRPAVILRLEQFLQGAASFHKPARAATFLLMTCIICLLDGTGVMLTSRAFSLDLTLAQSLLLLIALGLSSAVPSAPGYVGVYQFVAVTVLALFGYSQSQALAYNIVTQVSGMFLILL